MIVVPGAELHHTTRGQGSTCLFLCVGGVRPNEVQTPPALSDRLRLVHVDLRFATAVSNRMKQSG